MKTLATLAATLLSGLVTTAHAQTLVVPVRVDPFSAEHDSVEVDPGLYAVSDLYRCGFDPFEFDPATHDSVSFVISQAARAWIPDVYAGANVVASSDGCDGSFSFTANQRTGSPALVDDSIRGQDVPDFVTDPSVLDAEITDPGFYAYVITEPGDDPWTLSQLTLGVPGYALGADTYAPCVCALWFTTYQPADRRSFASLIAPASLIDVVEADADECDDGGIIVHTGLDDGLPEGTPGDGELQEEERDQSRAVCDGANGDDGDDGDDGAGSLIEVSALSATDSECPAGGSLIEVGLDDGEGEGTPDDGELHADEVDSARVVCNGATDDDAVDGGAAGPGGGDGLDAAARTIQIPEGDAQCPNGGVRIATGTDSNGNGELDDSEIGSSEVLCEPGASGGGDGGGCSAAHPGRSAGGAAALVLLGTAALVGRRRNAR
jgi:uncharacterized protein (TIGR03382 family)